MNKEKDIVYLTSILFGLKHYVNLESYSFANYYDNYSEKITSINIEVLLHEAEKLSLGGENIELNDLSHDLISILDTIKRPSGYTPTYYERSTPLQLNDSLLPSLKKNDTSDLKTLWHLFSKEFEHIQSTNIKSLAENILSLLYKYGSRVAVQVNGQCDVSLYDHIKTMAAISMCLYENHIHGETDNNAFRLVGADFSGIQQYIYQIVSKYAAKNLKGRSFYLRMLSDAVVRYLLQELELYSANVVYNSGGGFYLITPNTPSVINKLQTSILNIEKELFKKHSLSLYIAIDSVVLSQDDLLHKTNRSLGDIWGELFLKRDKKKFSKFADQIKLNGKTFFNPYMTGGECGQDTITGEEFIEGENIKHKETLCLKEDTYLQIEIGKKLKETTALLVIYGEKISSLEGLLHIQPCNLGITYYFVSDIAELKPALLDLKAKGSLASLVVFNGDDGNCNFFHYSEQMPEIVHKLEFYGGTEYKMKVWETFESMCKTKGDFTRLGVLRMDVDNLGSIFQSGIEKSKASLDRFASLSRSFDVFFSGYLNTLWKEKFSESSSIIYSGGDDAFIVGSWESTIEFAKNIRERFAEFACHNPAFSISCGIAILQPKYPIMKGAKESANEEDAAKDHSCSVYEKNSISFMGMPLNWEHEFPVVEKLKDQIVRFLVNKDLPKSFIQKILLHYSNSNMKNHVIHNIKTYWMLTYDLSRMKERYKKCSDIIDSCILEVCTNKKDSLNRESISTNYNALELWALAARWSELEYRTKQ